MLLLLLLLQCMHEKSLGKQIKPATKLLCSTVTHCIHQWLKPPCWVLRLTIWKYITANLLELKYICEQGYIWFCYVLLNRMEDSKPSSSATRSCVNCFQIRIHKTCSCPFCKIISYVNLGWYHNNLLTFFLSAESKIQTSGFFLMKSHNLL